MSKSPISHLPIHIAAESRVSLPNTCEVFQGECLARKECILTKLLADVVVHPPLIIGRATANAPQVLSSILCASALQEGTDTLCAAATGFDGIARISAAFAVCGKVYDAQVNSQNAVRLHERRVWNTHRRQQVEVAAVKGQVALPLLEGEKPALIVAANERQTQATGYRPDGHYAPVNIPVQDAVIVGNRAVRLERVLNLVIEFIGIRNLSVTPNDYLRGQVKGGAGGRIRSFVERVPAERLVFPSPYADAVTGSVGAGKRFFEGFGLRLVTTSLTCAVSFTAGLL